MRAVRACCCVVYIIDPCFTRLGCFAKVVHVDAFFLAAVGHAGESTQAQAR